MLFPSMSIVQEVPLSHLHTGGKDSPMAPPLHWSARSRRASCPATGPGQGEGCSPFGGLSTSCYHNAHDGNPECPCCGVSLTRLARPGERTESFNPSRKGGPEGLASKNRTSAKQHRLQQGRIYATKVQICGPRPWTARKRAAAAGRMAAEAPNPKRDVIVDPKSAKKAATTKPYNYPERRSCYYKQESWKTLTRKEMLKPTTRF